MFYNQYIHFTASAATAALAYLIIIRHPRSLVHRLFALAVALLAVEAFFNGLSASAVPPDRIQFWQHWRFAAASLLPGVWLAFALTFGQKDAAGQLKKWQWGIAAIFITYPALITPLFGQFFKGPPVLVPPGGYYLPLGKAGFIFSVLFILGIVLVMTLLERVLRSSRGAKRWQIKFLVLGTVIFFGIRIFTISQGLLFRNIKLNLEAANSAALVITSLLIVVSFMRTRVLPADIYVSPRVIQNSITVTLVGVYFIVIGIFATIAGRTETKLPFEVLAFAVFVAIMSLTAILMSDRVRQFLKQFVSRHFAKPIYDYRRIWETFTGKTATILDRQSLCRAAAKFISETMEVLSVYIWIRDEHSRQWILYGSTVHTEAVPFEGDELQSTLDEIASDIEKRKGVIDRLKSEAGQVRKTYDELSRQEKELWMRYFLPLTANEEFLGLIALGDKVGYVTLSFEEEELLKTLANQLAGRIQNIRLSEALVVSQEMEALQTFSAFFVHDLKNISSKLSLMLHNLPEHFDNPDFKDDSLRLISQSVASVNELTGRISQFRENMELSTADLDLNSVVRYSLEGLREAIPVPITEEYETLPNVAIDFDNFSKVVTNLILNANDACNDSGKIIVQTSSDNDSVVLSVADNGCGMSADFIATSLFRPFATTKDNGLGIGLYHCKTIVEAHDGRIEAESREGVGSTFRVFLPVAVPGLET